MTAAVPRHQRIIIELSLGILRKAMERSGRERVDTIEVRLALRCLLPHCADSSPLKMFWEWATVDAGADHARAVGRGQNCTAAFNGIARQLRLAGRYPE